MYNTIAVVGYEAIDLDDIDNRTIAEQIVESRGPRLSDDPRQTDYEDIRLPESPEVAHLIARIDAAIKRIDERLIASPNWAHVLYPGESTMYHSHGVGHVHGPGLSWVYYAAFPPDSGDLIFVCHVNERTVYRRVIPEVGRLLVFSSSMPHMTSRHAGEGPRVSISGNYFFDSATVHALLDGTTESRVSNYTG